MLNTTIEVQERPRVSVIIPTHNRADLLKEALDSVLSQEGVDDLFDIEAIVIDDASSDTTQQVLQQYRLVRYIRFETNRGASAARNAGIRASTGKYIAFLDDDDLFLPHRLKVQVPIVESRPDVDVVYGQGIVKHENSLEEIWPETRWGFSGRVFEAFLTQHDLDVFNINTFLVRREAFARAGLFDENLKTMEHHDMCLRLAFHCCFAFVPGPVSFGRASHKGKWFTNVVSGESERAVVEIIEKALRLLPDNVENERIRAQAREAGFSIVAAQRWINGGVTRVIEHLLAALRQYPWISGRASFSEQLYRIGHCLAIESKKPLSALFTVSEQLVSSLNGQNGRPSLAYLWRGATRGFSSTRHPYGTVVSALMAIIQDPASLRLMISPKRVVRFLLSSRVVTNS